MIVRYFFITPSLNLEAFFYYITSLTCNKSRWICSVISWMSESMVFISQTEELGAMKTSSFTGPLLGRNKKTTTVS